MDQVIVALLWVTKYKGNQNALSVGKSCTIIVELYTCVIMTPLIVLIHNGLIGNTPHDLWQEEEYFYQSGFQYLISIPQALSRYLQKFTPMKMNELQKEQIRNGKLLDLQKIETCSYASADGIEIMNRKMTDIYKISMQHFIDVNKIDSGDLYLSEKTNHVE